MLVLLDGVVRPSGGSRSYHFGRPWLWATHVAASRWAILVCLAPLAFGQVVSGVRLLVRGGARGPHHVAVLIGLFFFVAFLFAVYLLFRSESRGGEGGGGE